MTSPRAPILSARGLWKRFARGGSLARAGGEPVVALRGVDLDVREGDIQALVGRSGSGKTTFALCALRLLRPEAGTVVFGGRDISHLPEASLRSLRPQLQVVLQDPWGSLTPHRRVRALIAEPLRAHGLARGSDADDRAALALDEVGLDRALLDARPAELSGGQRQRVALARALALGPRLLVCDEPTSAVDLSEQARILTLLAHLRDTRRLSCLFVSHDLAVVRHFADRVAVMDDGRVVEEGPTREVFEEPGHPATRALLAAAGLLGSSRA